MEYLLFIIYLVLLAWLVTKTAFFTATGLSKPQLVMIFLLKVIAGIFYGWMGIYYNDLAGMGDTWRFHEYGLEEYRLLGQDPQAYFTNLFPTSAQLSDSFFGSFNSYWNDLKTNVFSKLLSVFDIFSMGHYYVNVIFYSFLSLFGSVAVYRVMKDLFPASKIMVLIASFFVPSFFYWSSGLHKEGIIFLGIGLIIFHLYFGAKERKFTLKRWLGVGLGLLLLLLLRNFVLLVIVPAMLAWLMAVRWPKYRIICFAGVYFIFGVLFFTLRYIDPRLDFPQAVVDKQKVFMALPGNSSIEMRPLSPGAASFWANIPQTISVSILRPYPTDIRHLPSLFAAIEIYLLLLLLPLFLLFHRKGLKADSTICFFLFFSISLLLCIGFSVNNIGAIVRYRSIVLPLLVTPAIANINWTKLTGLFIKGGKKGNGYLPEHSS